jgi:DNA repair protein RadA/Sms
LIKKDKFIFQCQACGHQVPKWMGQCPECGAWDTFTEERLLSNSRSVSRPAQLQIKPVAMDSIELEEAKRIQTGIDEFDRVLGGGIVAGSLILIGGDPGIGKSTLMLQVLSKLSDQGKKTLYISGEESINQIKLRGKRLLAEGSNMFVAAQTDLNTILALAQKEKYDACVIDSIQTVFNPEASSTPGSVTQIREASMEFMKLSKGKGIPIFLVGHVTKVGAIAGPRIMEHMVDTVLYFEGDKSHVFRILRSVKNRFGSTNEIGVFEMKTTGLEQVPNPSAVFLSERFPNAPGSVVAASMEGTRPILIEIQGLASTSGFGTPRRTVLGLDQNRVALIISVMEKRLEMNISGLDIFMSVAGGVKVTEPAADLGIATALASSFFNKPINDNTVLIGEIGLTSEIRAVAHIESRIKEASKMGFSQCIVPNNAIKQISKIKNIKVVGVSFLKEVMEILF